MVVFLILALLRYNLTFIFEVNSLVLPPPYAGKYLFIKNHQLSQLPVYSSGCAKLNTLVSNLREQGDAHLLINVQLGDLRTPEFILTYRV